ncbi:MAG: ribonuclease III [Mycoplasmataceae bacterium]|nr:ribonuclease III [Mycoplasmataceae bacterium]
MKQKIEKFLKQQHINAKNIDIYVEAFTHMSYSHESKKKSKSYERLEFLGDSILGKIVAKYIYQTYPEMTPGDMSLLKSNVVNKYFLAKIGRKLHFENYMLLGQGEDRKKISDSVYEDILESLIAAIYLDDSYEQAKLFIAKYIFKSINNINLNDLKDYKTKLQELLQAEQRKAVEYFTVPKKDSQKKLFFVSKVKLDQQILGQGEGVSKKMAEQNAAKDAYERVAT